MAALQEVPAPAGPAGPQFSVYNPPKPIEVQISATRTAEGKNAYTVYIILVKWQLPNQKQSAWTVSRRFSEFEALHKALSDSISNLPALPAKTWLRNFGSDFVNKRRQELNEWLHAMLRLPAAVHRREWQDFLEYSANNIEVPCDHLPSLDLKLPDAAFGVNDFVLHSNAQGQAEALFTVTEDAHLLSRVDATIANMRLPWEDKGMVAPLGSLNIWRLSADGVWDVTHTEYFEQSASSLAWDPLRRLLFVGLEDGHINTYLVDVDYKSAALISSLPVHAARVTSLIFIPARDTLVSCSRDKSLFVLSVRSNGVSDGDSSAVLSVQSQAIFEPAWLSSAVLDAESQRAMLGTYAGTIVIYDLNTNPPRLMHTLAGHKGSVRCVHFVPKQNYLFSGSFDNSVGVWQIGRIEDTHRSRSVGWFAGGPPSKIKSVTFLRSLNQTVSGHESGKLALWDVMTGKLLLVFDGHRADVVKLTWIDEQRVLISGARDGEVRFWQFPGGPARDRPRQSTRSEQKEAAPTVTGSASQQTFENVDYSAPSSSAAPRAASTFENVDYSSATYDSVDYSAPTRSQARDEDHIFGRPSGL